MVIKLLLISTRIWAARSTTQPSDRSFLGVYNLKILFVHLDRSTLFDDKHSGGR